MTGDVTIRPYTHDDLPAVIEIFKLNIPEYFDSSELSGLQDYLILHGDSYLVVEYQEKISGGAGWYINADDNSGRITWIFFRPEHAGKGLGRTVVERCLHELERQDSIDKLVVTTSQKAYGFFAKFGFETTRTEKDHWGPGLDLYVMERSIPDTTV